MSLMFFFYTICNIPAGRRKFPGEIKSSILNNRCKDKISTILLYISKASYSVLHLIVYSL